MSRFRISKSALLDGFNEPEIYDIGLIFRSKSESLSQGGKRSRTGWRQMVGKERLRLKNEGTMLSIKQQKETRKS